MAEDPGRRGVFVARARTRTRRELRGETRFLYAPEVPWEQHAAELSAVWAPGQHVGIIAPTDWGKTHLVLHGLAPIWSPRQDMPWLTIDVKGDDPTQRGWGKAVRKLPPRVMRDREDEQVWRLLVTEGVFSKADQDSVGAKVANTLALCRREKGWVIHVNEAAALAGLRPPDLNLGPRMKMMWQRGRPHITVIAETQRPADVPRAMYDQASHVYMGGPVDDAAVKRLAEIGGDTNNIVRILHLLREPQFLYFRRRGRVMQIVTAPDH